MWGPAGWFFIHSIAMGYPETPTTDQQQAAIDFFASLRNVLPCEECKRHYCANCDDSSLRTAVASRDTLIRWTVDLHNKVNLSLNKKRISYEQAIVQLERWYDEDKPWRGPRRAALNKCAKILLLVSAIVLSLIICGFVLRAWIRCGCPG